MSDVSFMEFLKRSRFDFKKAKKYKKEYSKIMKAGLFDKNFYLKSYPHIKKSGMDPLIHYLFYGYSEGKSPNNTFDNSAYLKKYPEIEENGLNPLIYYIDNNHEGFILEENPFEIKKRRIFSTNNAFLNNFQFEKEPLVSIIILNRNGLDYLKCLFEDFDKKTNYSNYEIIVVDNASSDESVEYLKGLKKDLPITVIENNENVTFSKGNNDASKIAKGEYLVLLNNDIEPTYGWLNELVGFAENNENVGSVGAKLIFPYYTDIENQPKSFSIQHEGVKFKEEMTPYIYGPFHEDMFNTLIFRNKLNKPREVIANTAACILIPKKVYEDLGGLDEQYIYGYEDVDFALKLYENGYKSFYNPQALLIHYETATRHEDDEKKNQLNYINIMHFYDKWGNLLFEKMLEDKITEKFFFTDKKINIAIITKDEENKFIKEFFKQLSTKYDVKLITDFENIYLGESCDIVISFDENYDLEEVISRLNLIKILIQEDSLVLKGIDSINTKDKNIKIKSNNGKDFAFEIMDVIKDTYLRGSD